MALSLVFAPGFVCASRVERLEAQSEALKLQFEEIQQRMNNDQAQLTERVLQADEKLRQMEELQGRLMEVLQRNSVDLGDEIAQLKGEVQTLRGQMEAEQLRTQRMQDQLSALLTSLNFGSGGQAVQIPEEMEAHYTLAQERFTAGAFAEAEALFKAFFQRYPNDSRADVALMRQGEALRALEDHAGARQVFQSFMRSYPSSRHIETVIYLNGQSALALGDCQNARTLLEAIKDRDRHGSDARAALRRIERGEAECR